MLSYKANKNFEAKNISVYFPIQALRLDLLWTGLFFWKDGRSDWFNGISTCFVLFYV